MTFPDLGPERPGPASSTRSMIERDRSGSQGDVQISGRAFWIALGVIVVVIALFALVLAATS